MVVFIVIFFDIDIGVVSLLVIVGVEFIFIKNMYIVIDVNGGILIYFVIYNFILGGIYFSIVLMCKYY